MSKLDYYFRVIKRKFVSKFVIPKYSEKRKIILDYKKKYNCENFVETGTFMGETVFSMISSFKKIVSIELQSDLAKKAKQRFSEFNHIEILEGDSKLVLPFLNESFKNKTLYWLDGHYSGEFFVGNQIVRSRFLNRF